MRVADRRASGRCPSHCRAPAPQSPVRAPLPLVALGLKSRSDPARCCPSALGAGRRLSGLGLGTQARSPFCRLRWFCSPSHTRGTRPGAGLESTPVGLMREPCTKGLLLHMLVYVTVRVHTCVSTVCGVCTFTVSTPAGPSPPWAAEWGPHWGPCSRKPGTLRSPAVKASNGAAPTTTNTQALHGQRAWPELATQLGGWAGPSATLG